MGDGANEVACQSLGDLLNGVDSDAGCNFRSINPQYVDECECWIAGSVGLWPKQPSCLGAVPLAGGVFTSVFDAALLVYDNCITFSMMGMLLMSGSMRDSVLSRRDRAVSMAMKRKEEYLGARVPKELRDRVIQRAKEMGIPVSILMRNILEEAFKEDGAGEALVSVAATLHRAPATKFESVLGWDRIVLNRPVSCTNCGVQLAAGMDVTLGLGAAQPVILCDVCRGSV